MRRRNLLALVLLAPAPALEWVLRWLGSARPKPEPTEKPLPPATVERIQRAVHFEEYE